MKAEIERGGPRVDLDLQELDLVDVEGVRFLNACEAEGISVLHCSPFISGNGCSGNEGRPKAPTHKRNKGKAGWGKKMESRYGEVPSPLQVVTSINEASLLATAKSGETAARATLYT